MIQHRTEVLQVYEKQSPLISNPEHYVKYAFLGLVELKKSGEKLGAHIRDSCPHRMTLLSVDIEETHRATGELWGSNAEFGTALLYESAHRTGLADAGKITLHVSHETRHASLTEGLGNDLKSHCLTCSGSSGNQSMAISHFSAYRDGAGRAVGHIKAMIFRIHYII